MWRRWPLVRAVYSKVIEAGGNPSLMLTDETLVREFRASRERRTNRLVTPHSRCTRQRRRYIRCTASPNTRAMTNIDAKRVQKIQAARRPWLETRMRAPPRAK